METKTILRALRKATRRDASSRIKHIINRYQQVKITRYDFMYGKSLHFTAKSAVFSALDRLKKIPGKSIAILVPSKRLMLEFSYYLSSVADSLPELHHDVAMDAEPPALAAGVIATLLAGGAGGDVASRMLGALHSHIRGPRGAAPHTDRA